MKFVRKTLAILLAFTICLSLLSLFSKEESVKDNSHYSSENNTQPLNVAIKPPSNEKSSKQKMFDESIKQNLYITYLIIPSEEPNLIESLNLLCRNFLAQFTYPVILFHDPKYAEENLAGLRDKIQEKVISKYPNLNVIFQLIEWKLPAHYDQTKDPPRVWLQDFPGYHLMIRFWFKQVFWLPVLSKSRYYLRLDTDSFIQSPITEDPFWVMYDKGYSYAWRAIDTDEAFVTVGMAEFMVKYNATHTTNSVKNGLSFPDPTAWPYYKPPMMYNNFEIVDLDRFRAKDMTDFVSAVDATNYILTRRWGDAPLRYLQAKMILDWDKEVWNIKSFDYLHGHHKKFMAKGSNIIQVL